MTTSNTLPTDHVYTSTTYVNAAGAAKLLEDHTWVRQRPINRFHVDYLVGAMSRGELTQIEATFAELPGGTRYLIDGYHRFTALEKTNLTLPCLIKTYPVEDEAALIRLYLVLDRPYVRTVTAMMRASGLDEHTSLSPGHLKAVGSAAALVEYGFGPNYRMEKSMIRRTEITQRWLPEGEQFFLYLAGCTNEVRGLLIKQPVMAVGITTIRYCPTQAYDFWRPLALEDALERGDPRHRLLAWLRLNKRIATYGFDKYARYVATAWNAWIEGRPLQLMRPLKGEHFRLMGTPFDGTGQQGERWSQPR